MHETRTYSVCAHEGGGVMKRHGFLAIALAAVVGSVILSGEASAISVTWDYKGGPPAIIPIGSQPKPYTSSGYDAQASGYTFTLGGGGSFALTPAALGQNPSTGLGVCSQLAGCLQTDRINANEMLRIHLPDPSATLNSIVLGLVASNEALYLYGSNIAAPAFTSDLTLLWAGMITSLGTNIEIGTYFVPILSHPTGYADLYFTPANGSDGYSLRGLTASVPEPSTFLLFGSAIFAFAALRRRLNYRGEA